ncbi:MAG: VanZ family protein [Ignavibacteriales bacterium]|jgi:VanZ family protein|nr:VanZ family protein [Ignavibacteriales bacterium]MBK7265232.1 VanZ family protein [Ignavibacteriales bacterium]MBK8661673.1 VanZ family protein [Ignavibacteriales bacterium]MBP9123602.1 VanZ family protein [Ignavibacteriaceae bacterium]MCC6636530.1 VanZ family protein [Ignavibacteriaceae bacterium]
MQKINKQKIALWVLVGYWIILFLGTTLPSSNLPDVPSGDKLNHFAGYAVLSFLLFTYLKLKSADTVDEIRIFQKSFIIASVYGILDELHQIPIPGRFFEWYDILADINGAALGLALAFILNRAYPKLFK